MWEWEYILTRWTVRYRAKRVRSKWIMSNSVELQTADTEPIMMRRLSVLARIVVFHCEILTTIIFSLSYCQCRGGNNLMTFRIAGEKILFISFLSIVSQIPKLYLAWIEVHSLHTPQSKWFVSKYLLRQIYILSWLSLLVLDTNFTNSNLSVQI